jgi:hypothetical protein
MDKGDDTPTGHETVVASPYTPHRRRIGEERREATGEKS